MLNFSKKNDSNPTPMPDEWKVLRGEYAGKAIFIRARQVSNMVGSERFPFQIGVVIPLKNPTEAGLPQGSELQELNLIEDELDAILSKDGLLYVMSITTGGMREFVFYAPEWKPEYFESKVKTIQDKFEEHQLQFMMKCDPKWETYTSLLIN